MPQILINSFSLRGILFEVLDKISAFGYIFIPISFLIFSLSFVGKTRGFRKYSFWAALFIPAFIFLLLSWSTNLIEDHASSATIVNNWGYTSPPGRYFILFLFWFECVMLLGIGFIANAWHKEWDKAKNVRHCGFLQPFFYHLQLVLLLMEFFLSFTSHFYQWQCRSRV